MIPVITLTNGLKVGNFSSGHSFVFTDGSVLPECEPDIVDKMMLDTIEISTDRVVNDTKYSDIRVEFKLNDTVNSHIRDWQDAHNKYLVDIVITPLPVLTAMKATYGSQWLSDLPFRTVRVAQRAKDNNKPIIHIDKFCL